MIPEWKQITGPGFAARVYAEGDEVFTLEAANRKLLVLGRCHCGGFAEDGALVHKLRRHSSLDGLSASINAESVIPFGCEYLVGRELELFDGVGSWTTDVAAVNFGIVRAVELEPVHFPGPWKTLEYLVYGEAEYRKVELAPDETEFHRGRETVVSIRLTAADNVKVEFNAGGDLWRHRTAMHEPAVSGEFLLAGNCDGVSFLRKIFSYPEEAAVAKRPWRFKNSFGWSVPGEGEEPVGEETVFDLTEEATLQQGFKTDSNAPCLTSPSVRKAFRNFIRRADSNLCIKGISPGLCRNAAHLERPNKKELEHLDLDDVFNFYLWGNRQLLKRGFRLRFEKPQSGVFRHSVCVKNLARHPRGPIED